MVDSEYFSDVTYAIDKEKKGMWLIVGKQIIAMDLPSLLAKEIQEVWEQWKQN